MSNPVATLFRIPELKEKILFTLFILAIYLVHPHLGFIVVGSALALLVIARINQTATALVGGDPAADEATETQNSGAGC